MPKHLYRSRKGRKTFKDYQAAGYGPHLLTIAPPGAPISPATKALQPNKLGKTPATWLTEVDVEGYVGTRQWTNCQATEADVAKWDEQLSALEHPPSVGLQGRAFPAVDIDVEDEGLAAALTQLALDILGAAPKRIRADPERRVLSARLALFYRSATPIRSWTFAFRDSSGQEHGLEFKANKRQMVVDGPHQRGGYYDYQSDGDLVSWGAQGLTEISEIAAAEFERQAKALLISRGCVIITNERDKYIGTAPEGLKAISAPSLEHVREALEAVENCDDIDRDEWVKVAHRVKGACLDLEEDGKDLLMDWSLQNNMNLPDDVDLLWRGLAIKPYTGWPQLARWAEKRSNGAYKADLSAYEEAEKAAQAALREAAITEMFQTQVWVENQERVFDLGDQRLRNKLQFNPHFAHIGKASSKGGSAWDIFVDEPDKPTPSRPEARRQSVFDFTYRPGAGLFVDEGGERRVNIWKPATGLPDRLVLDQEIGPWLHHVALIVPDPVQRQHMLDWMASVAQRQAEKPNHGLVIGGKHGIGKSMMVEPLKVALGRHNVQEIMANQLDDKFSGWLVGAKLFVVEEMMNFDKREMMQRLKNYLAAPPHTLPVNPKYGKPITIPNLVTGIFFTNHEDAVAIEPGERRFFVIWSDAAKQAPEYFADLDAWYKGGGAALAAGWLLQRDISGYNMLGEAPFTQAREDMRKAARSKLDELIEDAIEAREGPFRSDLVALDDVRRWVGRQDVLPHHNLPTAARVSKALKDAGAQMAHDAHRRPALGNPPEGVVPPDCSPKQARLLSVRNHARYRDLSNADLVREFWLQWAPNNACTSMTLEGI